MVAEDQRTERGRNNMPGISPEVVELSTTYKRAEL